MNRLLIVVALLAVAVGCTPQSSRTSDIDDTRLFLGVSVGCDGDASLTDWLVVFEADTTDDVIALEADVFQGGDTFGPTHLDETRPGSWYGEVWEDDLGMDCEGGAIQATFYATDSDGNQETLDF